MHVALESTIAGWKRSPHTSAMDQEPRESALQSIDTGTVSSESRLRNHRESNKLEQA